MSKTVGSRSRLIWSPTNSAFPFLYHTRSIQQPHQIPQGCFTTSSRRCLHASAWQQDDVPVRRSNLSRFLRERAPYNEKQRTSVRSTITQAEQDAFDSVMRMFTPSSPETQQAKATSADNHDVAYQNILDMFTSTEAQTNEPLSELGARERPRNLSVDDHTTFPSSRTDAAAELAHTFAGRSPEALYYQQPGSATQLRVNATASAVMQKVSKSFEEALQSQKPAPDVALWRVCEECVFPLISLLNIKPLRLSEVADQSSPADAPVQGRDTESDEASVSSLAQSALPSHIASLIPPDIPVLPLLTRLYPAALLLAIRLYLRHQPSSPLALALLPRIRQLGPTSYVLGANTPFYNALISLRWDVYSDMKAIDGLLFEMQHGGVEMDESTFAVTKRIRGDRLRDMERAQEGQVFEEGARAIEWWNRTEQKKWYQRVAGEWKDLIASRLGQRGVRVTMDGDEDDKGFLGERSDGWDGVSARLGLDTRR